LIAAGDVGRPVRSEERDQRGDVLGRGDAPERDPRVSLGPGPERLVVPPVGTAAEKVEAVGIDRPGQIALTVMP
jgi:hypothetical protein